MLNLNFGRSLFFNGGKSEIKILSTKPDSKGHLTAQIQDLTTGKRTYVLIKTPSMNHYRGTAIEIVA